MNKRELRGLKKRIVLGIAPFKIVFSLKFLINKVHFTSFLLFFKDFELIEYNIL